MAKRYRIEVTEKQAEVISRACEFWARIRMGQFNDLYMSCFLDRPRTEQIDYAIRALETAIPRSNKRDEWVELLFDIHQVIRHRLAWDRDPAGERWNVHYGEPLIHSVEPAVKIEGIL